jgi:hypothetical protein
MYRLTFIPESRRKTWRSSMSVMPIASMDGCFHIFNWEPSSFAPCDRIERRDCGSVSARAAQWVYVASWPDQDLPDTFRIERGVRSVATVR